MNIENIPNELFDLLSCKHYSELSEKEKKLVAKVMSQEEYLDYQAVINDFKELDSALEFEVPKLAIQPKNKSTLRKIINYRIPLYQVAAGVLLLTVSTFVFGFWDRGSITPFPEIKEGEVRIEHLNGKSLAEEDYPDSLIFNF